MNGVTLSKWNNRTHNRFAVLGMSGLGKTFLSTQLKKSKTWEHYSVDYEIGKILFTDKNSDFRNGFSINNLSNLSIFLGKPGNPSKGGIGFTEYIRRQRLHKQAEILATLKSSQLIQKTRYDNFICDTSGSICEIVNPSDPNDKILKTLSENFLIVCLEADNDTYETLIRRFTESPKPMYYEEPFLRMLWEKYLLKTNQDENKIDPDDFILYGYKALVERRKKLFYMISKNWGLSVNFNDIRKIKSGSDFVKLVKTQLNNKLVK